MEDVTGAPEVPPTLPAIQAAKTVAQDLFGDGKTNDARQATTAALQAARRLLATLADPDPDDEIPLGGGKMPSADEVEALVGVLYSNRSLLMLRQIEAGDAAALAHGAEAAWGLVARDANRALDIEPSNFKASFRRARALFEMGDLEAALGDATRVVEHYARTSPTPNPEAAALRDRILEAIQQDRRKWGQRGPARWNRAGLDAPLISDLGGGPAADGRRAPGGAPGAAGGAAHRPVPAALVRRVAAAPTKGPGAPRTGGEVEKVLLSTLKADATQRLAYVTEHLPAEAIRKLFRRAPLGPDLLAALVRALADLAAEDAARAAASLSALAEAPSALTQARMFDAEEKGSLEKLLKLVGPEAAAPWRPSGDEQEE